MSKTPKRLCSWKKDDIKENREALHDLVRDSRYVCRKCARASRDKDALCKPDKL